MTQDEQTFLAGLYQGYQLAIATTEAREKRYRAYPGRQMAAANEAFDEAVKDFKDLAEEQIMTEFDINKDEVPSLTRADAIDCYRKFNEMVDITLEMTNDTLLDTMLGVLGR